LVGSSAADFDEALATLPRLDTRRSQVLVPLGQFEKALEAARSRTTLKTMLRVDATAR